VKPIARPVNLDLLRIHLPLPGWVSILHRISGALLFAALPLGVWALSVSLSGEAGFQRMADCVTHPLPKLFLLLLIWAFAQHFFAGLRHLAMDVHWMTSLQKARLSSRLVLGLDVLSVSALAFVIW
jgi:succinate dehydrogenase / fumarate reductase cytochrome b subunit